MGWKDSSFEEEKNVAWDLRRIWAEKIIGITVQEIQQAMRIENYPTWFHLMKRDLRTEIFKNLSNKEREEIDNEIYKCKIVLNKCSNAYLGRSKEPNEHEAVEDALSNLYILMTTLMDKNGLFGRGEEDIGL